MAYVQIAGGILGVIELFAWLTRGGLVIALSALGLPIGFGLLRLSRGWRTCCVALLQLGIAVGLVFAVLALTGSAPARLEVLGVKVADVPRGWVVVAAVALCLFLWWQLRVLCRPDVSRLFRGSSGPQAAAVEAPPAARR